MYTLENGAFAEICGPGTLRYVPLVRIPHQGSGYTPYTLDLRLERLAIVAIAFAVRGVGRENVVGVPEFEALVDVGPPGARAAGEHHAPGQTRVQVEVQAVVDLLLLGRQLDHVVGLPELAAGGLDVVEPAHLISAPFGRLGRAVR